MKLLWHQIPVSALSRHEGSRWLLCRAQRDTRQRTEVISRLRPGMCPGLRFAFLAGLSTQMGLPITVPGSCILLSARLVRAFYLACHHQCRAAGPGRRPAGPFRLLSLSAFDISFSLAVSSKVSGFVHDERRHDVSYPRGSGYARFRLHSFFSLISAVAAFPDSPFHCFFSLHLINRDRGPVFLHASSGLA